MTTPRSHAGSRYAFQFQGCSDADWKHRKKVSSTMAEAASVRRLLISSKSTLHMTAWNEWLVLQWHSEVGFLAIRPHLQQVTLMTTETPLFCFNNNVLSTPQALVSLLAEAEMDVLHQSNLPPTCPVLICLCPWPCHSRTAGGWSG